MSHFEPTVPQPQPQSATAPSQTDEPNADWHRNHIKSLIDIRKDTNDVNFFIIYNLH
jgi:hypothetical protein